MSSTTPPSTRPGQPVAHPVDHAKQLAKLLRTDLATAGVTITHSLALELIAHQHGAKDWNTYVATSAAASAASGSRHPVLTDEGQQAAGIEWVTHDSTPMTLGQLRAAMTSATDDLPVLLTHPDEAGPDGARSTIYASSAGIRPNSYAPGDALAIEGDLPPGTYQRARRLTLTVTGLSIGDEGQDTVQRLIEEVEAATEPLGHNGSSSMVNSPEDGTISWTWTAHNVALLAIAVAARSAIQHHNPGPWTVSTAAPEPGIG